MSYFILDHSGLLIPRKIALGGRFGIEVIRNGRSLGPLEWSDNIVVDEFLNYCLDASLSAGSQKNSWYIGLFKGNYTPLASNTGATIASLSTELTEYTQTTRVAWTDAGPAAKTITNAANRATFTINASVTAYGAFLVSNSVKGDNSASSILCASSKFNASRDLIADDQLLVTYQISAADDGV